MSETSTKLYGHDLRWEDKQKFIHACESSEVHPGVRLVWTLCERDVPANKAFTATGQPSNVTPEPVTCATCKMRMH